MLPAGFSGVTWVGTHIGVGREGGRKTGEFRAPGVLLTLRSGPPIISGAKQLDSRGGRKMDRHARI